MATRGLAPWAYAVQGFGHPCFTYILKLPCEDKHTLESGFYKLCGGLQENILSQLGNINEEADQILTVNDLLDTFSPGDGHMHALAWAGYRAAIDVMKRKQYRESPQCSVWSQSELGATGFHVHIVLGGPGLSRSNATASRGWLLLSFFRHLLQTIRERMSPDNIPMNNLEHGAWSWIQGIASKVMRGDCDSLVDILKARSPAGHLHALGINGSQFITRYLLPKNREIMTCLPAALTTPSESFNRTWDGTYGYTVCNGQTVPEHLRQDLWKALYNTYAGHPADQMLQADVTIWRDLPNVSNNTIDVRDAALQSKPIKLSRKQKIMLELIQQATSKLLLSYNDLVEELPNLVLMLEGMPGGGKTTEQLLHMIHIKLCKKYDAFSFMLLKTPPNVFVSPATGGYNCNGNLIWKLLNFQGYNPWQVGHWLFLMLMKKTGKKNSALFFGPASTGKTNLAKAICHAIGLYGCVNHNNKQFPFNDAPNKLVLWWEECIMTTDYVEAAKCILGGTHVRVDVKHKDSKELPQTPVIISSNHDIYTVQGGNATYGVHAAPLKERITQFNFMKQLSNTFGEITPQMASDWLAHCKKMRPGHDSIEGFLWQYSLDSVPNSFPLQQLCPGHTQNWTFADNGVCWHCGGFIQPTEEPDDSDTGSNHSAASDRHSDASSAAGELLVSEEDSGIASTTSTTPSLPDLEVGPVHIEEPSECLQWMQSVIESMSAHDITAAANSALPFILDPIAEEPEPAEERAVVPEIQELPTSHPNSPVAKRAREDTDEVTLPDNELPYESQPVTSQDWDEWIQWRDRAKRRRLEREPAEPMETETEPQPGPSNVYDPAKWGDKLGILKIGFTGPPVVLHCFETLQNSDSDSD